MGNAIGTLKLKIFVIFLIPAISIIYFTFFYVRLSDGNIAAIERKKESVQLIEHLIDVIHGLQIERGLSAGAMTLTKNADRKKELFDIYKKNNLSIKRLESLHQYEPFQLEKLQNIREKFQKNSLSFEELISSYSQINTNLIGTLKYLLPRFNSNKHYPLFLIDLELLKENAGLERAYIYHELRSNPLDLQYENMIVHLQKTQSELLEDLNIYQNSESIAIYKKYIDSHNQIELAKLRKLYKLKEISQLEHYHWFTITSNTIDSYNKASKEVLRHLIIRFEEDYNKTLQNLNIAVLLWIVSIISAVYFLYLISKLFKQQEKYTEELELSSRTLDTYDGIVITDKDTNIIRVNNGFERITGYSVQDAIGRKTNILKSGKTPKSLYKAMWGHLKTKGYWEGELLNKRKDGKIYSQRLSISVVRDNKGEVKNYIGHFFDMTEIKKVQEEAYYQATHDSLTDLINRKLLLERISEEIGRSKRHDFKNAFLFIDLDNFKAINDTYGHHIGDQLLQHVAYSIKNSVRACDIVARISGDEFAVVLLDVDRANKDLDEAVSFVANKILTHLNNEIVLEANKIKVSSSIGIRLFPLNQYDNEDQIIKDADSAMYEAKNGGKNRFVIFQG